MPAFWRFVSFTTLLFPLPVLRMAKICGDSCHFPLLPVILILSLWDSPSPAKQHIRWELAPVPLSRKSGERSHLTITYCLIQYQDPWVKDLIMFRVRYTLRSLGVEDTDCSHCCRDKTWAKYCLDKSLACHALMEVLCWEHQAKAPTLRFPSISDSITHLLHDLGQTACNVTCRSTRHPCANQVTVFQLPSGKESKRCLSIWQAQSSIVPQASPMALHQEADAPLRWQQPRRRVPPAHESQHHHLLTDAFHARHSVRTANLCSSFRTNFCSLLKVFVSLPLNSNSSLFSAPGPHPLRTVRERPEKVEESCNIIQLPT